MQIAYTTKTRSNPDHALAVVVRAENARKSGCLETEASAMADGEPVYHQVESKTAAKRLILKHFKSVIDKLMHVSGLTKLAGTSTYLLFSPESFLDRLLMKKVAKPQNGLGIRHCERSTFYQI
ncbi:hypothetical protein IFO69_13325 [Echinicola sp. CAU 1574]|uniref:Uncharacterized protein n=1 Tax=Echinicola arenosa TaxID=2774144 RepID=A0ABR9ALR9_9BACT|nr:hypothetical protein [Echinicola arenosa]MBD8489732.1 hypothetical protein [Echinicola arenosa]